MQNGSKPIAHALHPRTSYEACRRTSATAHGTSQPVGMVPVLTVPKTSLHFRTSIAFAFLASHLVRLIAVDATYATIIQSGTDGRSAYAFRRTHHEPTVSLAFFEIYRK